MSIGGPTISILCCHPMRNQYFRASSKATLLLEQCDVTGEYTIYSPEEILIHFLSTCVPISQYINFNDAGLLLPVLFLTM